MKSQFSGLHYLECCSQEELIKCEFNENCLWQFCFLLKSFTEKNSWMELQIIIASALYIFILKQNYIKIEKKKHYYEMEILFPNKFKYLHSLLIKKRNLFKDWRSFLSFLFFYFLPFDQSYSNKLKSRKWVFSKTRATIVTNSFNFIWKWIKK